MRTLVYLVTFLIIAISAVASTTHYALLYFRVHLLGMFHGAGIPLLVFGALPFPTRPDPPPYIAIACSAPLLILALRRLVILARSGSFTPPEFRGFTYVVAWIGLGLILAAVGVYLFTHSVVITLIALSPASWTVMLAFFLGELTGPLKQRPVLKRFAVAMGVVTLAAIFLPWDVYVAKLAYDRLCVSRSGEKVYATVHTPSYLLVGEAPGSDGFGIYTAVNDVLDRRFSFVEVQRQQNNTTQANSLNAYFNYRVPEAEFFRISLGSTGSVGCLPADRGPILRATAKGQLKPGECLQFYPIEAPTSRYEIDVEYDAKPVWYTWRVFMQRVSVADRQTRSLLGESTVFQRVGGRLSSNRELEERECPKRRERRSLTELRKAVLLETP